MNNNKKTEDGQEENDQGPFGLSLKEVIEKENTLSCRDVVIAMLKGQLKKMEELYKKSLDEQQDLKYKQNLLQHELAMLKTISKKQDEENRKLSEKSVLDRSSLDKLNQLQQESDKWKQKYESVIEQAMRSEEKQLGNKQENTEDVMNHIKKLEEMVNNQNKKLDGLLEVKRSDNVPVVEEQIQAIKRPKVDVANVVTMPVKTEQEFPFRKIPKTEAPNLSTTSTVSLTPVNEREPSNQNPEKDIPTALLSSVKDSEPVESVPEDSPKNALGLHLTPSKNEPDTKQIPSIHTIHPELKKREKPDDNQPLSKSIWHLAVQKSTAQRNVNISKFQQSVEDVRCNSVTISSKHASQDNLDKTVDGFERKPSDLPSKMHSSLLNIPMEKSQSMDELKLSKSLPIETTSNDSEGSASNQTKLMNVSMSKQVNPDEKWTKEVDLNRIEPVQSIGSNTKLSAKRSSAGLLLNQDEVQILSRSPKGKCSGNICPTIKSLLSSSSLDLSIVPKQDLTITMDTTSNDSVNDADKKIIPEDDSPEEITPNKELPTDVIILKSPTKGSEMFEPPPQIPPQPIFDESLDEKKMESSLPSPTNEDTEAKQPEDMSSAKLMNIIKLLKSKIHELNCQLIGQHSEDAVNDKYDTSMALQKIMESLGKLSEKVDALQASLGSFMKQPAAIIKEITSNEKVEESKTEENLYQNDKETKVSQTESSQTVSDLQKENENLIEELEEKSRCICVQKQKIQQLEEKLREDSDKNLRKLIDSNKKLQDQISDGSQEERKLLGELTLILSKSEMDKNNLIADNDYLKRQLEAERKKFKMDRDAWQYDLNSLRAENDLLKAELDDINERLRARESEEISKLQKYKGDNADLQDKLKMSNAELKYFKENSKQNAKLRAENAKLKNKTAAMERRLNDLVKAEHVIDGLIVTNEMLRKKIGTLEKKLSASKGKQPLVSERACTSHKAPAPLSPINEEEMNPKRKPNDDQLQLKVLYGNPKFEDKPDLPFRDPKSKENVVTPESIIRCCQQQYTNLNSPNSSPRTSEESASSKHISSKTSSKSCRVPANKRYFSTNRPQQFGKTPRNTSRCPHGYSLR